MSAFFIIFHIIFSDTHKITTTGSYDSYSTDCYVVVVTQ